MSKFELGQKVKDLVTGFTGIATSRVEYLNGCTQYGVRGPVDDKNVMPEPQYIDQQQLELVGPGVVIEKQETGGDMPDAPKW